MQAIEHARKISRSVSLDLIFAAPGESLADWQRDLEDAIQLGPDHLSTYELTFEKGTQFWNRLTRNELSQAEEELRLSMYQLAIERLNSNGYSHYEISSFAKPGHRCQHNLTYWQGAPYFAFGPGASRYVDGIRETNHQSTSRYISLLKQNELPVADSDSCNPWESACERLWIGLRMIDGIPLNEFQVTTGFSVHQVLGPFLDDWLAKGLISLDSHVRLTGEGMMIADWIAGEINNRADAMP